MSDYIPGQIRDSRGLSALERLFLHTVHSRGPKGLFTTFETACADMSISVRTFRSVRQTLVDKGLLTVTERPSRTTLYRIDAEGLAAHWKATKTYAGDAQVDDETYAGDAHPTYAAGAQVPMQEVHTPPVQEVHTEGEPVKGNEKTNAKTNPPSAGGLDGVDLIDDPSQAVVIPLVRDRPPMPNKAADKCANRACGKHLQIGEGTRGKDALDQWVTYCWPQCPEKVHHEPTVATPEMTKALEAMRAKALEPTEKVQPQPMPEPRRLSDYEQWALAQKETS